MKKVKALLIGILTIAMLLSMAACGSSAKESIENTSAQASEQADMYSDLQTENDKKQQDNDQTAGDLESTDDDSSNEDTDASHADVLVVFFSATGTTKGVAERIASVTKADVYEITAADPYTADDLNYNDNSSRSTKEQNDKNVRPEIGSDDISLEGYTTIYLGFPIWWGEEPRILDTFVEKYDFNGITVIPFCTSGGSGIGRSGSNMESLAGTGIWLKGERFSGSTTNEEIQEWIYGLK